MKKYYERKKEFLKNKALINNNKIILLKENNLEVAIYNLLHNNSKRRPIMPTTDKKDIKTTLYFD